jgi:hypothetical protein
MTVMNSESRGVGGRACGLISYPGGNEKSCENLKEN